MNHLTHYAQAVQQRLALEHMVERTLVDFDLVAVGVHIHGQQRGNQHGTFFKLERGIQQCTQAPVFGFQGFQYL